MATKVKRQRIRRFPRLPAGKKRLSRTEKFEIRVRSGNLPRGYNRLRPVMRKVAKLYAGGEAVEKICKETGITDETFYRWRRAHPKFRKYLRRLLIHSIKDADQRILGRLPRAVRNIEDALESEDPYFAYQASKDMLKGLGRYRTSISSKSEPIKHEISGKIVEEHTLPKELLVPFIQALIQQGQGGEPPPIDITPEVRQLTNGSESEEVQESQPVLEEAAGTGKERKQHKRRKKAD